MKKQTLLPILAFAAVAVTTLSLPVTASADSFRHDDARTTSRSEQPRGRDIQPVHDRYSRNDRYDDDRRDARRFHHDHGRHMGHIYRYESRVEYRPIVREEYRPVVREEYRPVVREVYRPVEFRAPLPSDGVRIRLSYDLHM